MSSIYSSPIEPLAQAFYDAMHNQFPDVQYYDRDWKKYREWQDEHFNKLSNDEKRVLLDRERKTGIPMEPEYCNKLKTRRPSKHEIKVYAMFPQLWGSTALGFGGIGGAAMTTEYTIIFECFGKYAVYYGHSFAYMVEYPNQKFYDDISGRNIASVSSKGKYND